MKDNKKIIIIAGAIVLLIVLFLLVKVVFKRNLKNTTGSSDYSASKVDMNCVLNDSKDGVNIQLSSDFLFNYKSDRETYQLKKYNKLVYTYPNEISDEKYEKFVKDFNSIECLSKDCTANHLELGFTDLGWETTVDRKKNQLIVTYFNVYGLGQKATQSDIADLKDIYVKEGFNCK